MSPRVPFGIEQRQRATLHRDRFLDAEDMARHVGCIDCETNRTSKRHIFWRRNLGRQRQRRLRQRNAGRDEDAATGNKDQRYRFATAHLAPHAARACVSRSCATRLAVSTLSRQIFRTKKSRWSPAAVSAVEASSVT